MTKLEIKNFSQHTPQLKLGVNIDHVATVRNARGTLYPSILEAAFLAVSGGADQITVHLREDRRHIRDEDVVLLKNCLQVPLNLEMACTAEMLEFALKIKPSMVTLVPEKREEKTTEGGLELTSRIEFLKGYVAKLQDNQILTSLFIEPTEKDLESTLSIGAHAVELHTGKYSQLCDEFKNAKHVLCILDEIEKIKIACRVGHEKGIIVHAGHGLNLQNVLPIAQIFGMNDLNIGHSIVARALVVGLQAAVCEMKHLLNNVRLELSRV
jgi:pyridoxine 5-phosphate synthase